jgi:hypothetical protein
MNELLAYDKNATNTCDSYMVGWHKQFLFVHSIAKTVAIVLLENV